MPSRKRQPRRYALANLIRDVRDGIAFNQHFTGDGWIIFRHACTLGCEVSSQSDSARLILWPRRSLAQDQESGRLATAMTDWSDEETDDPVHADRSNFYKVEKWLRHSAPERAIENTAKPPRSP
jgi:hypothetical protein